MSAGLGEGRACVFWAGKVGEEGWRSEGALLFVIAAFGVGVKACLFWFPRCRGPPSFHSDCNGRSVTGCAKGRNSEAKMIIKILSRFTVKGDDPNTASMQAVGVQLCSCLALTLC